MDKKAIIVDRELSPSELEIALKDSETHIYINATLKNNPFTSSESLITIEENYEYKASVENFILQFPIDNEAIFKTCKEEDFNIWYWHRFRMYNDLIKSYPLLKGLEKLKNYSDIQVYTNEPLIAYLAPKNASVFLPTSPKKDKIGYLKSVLIRYFKSPRISSTNKHIILNAATSEQDCLTKSGIKKDNPYIQSVLENIDDKFLIIDELPIDITNVLQERIKSYPHERPFVFHERILLKSLASITDRKKVKNHLHKHIEKLEALNSGDTLEALTIQNLKNLSSTTKFYIQRFQAYKSHFKSQKPYTVSATGENNSLQKIVLDAANSESIPSIGIQHGTIHSANYNYKLSEADSKYFGTPAKMIVWGEYWKDALSTISNFNSENIFVSGQPRTDSISTTPNLEEPKNITYATQPFRDLSKRVEALQTVAEACSKLDEVCLIIRPHPAEKSNSFFEDILANYPKVKYKIDRKKDLYQSLNDCSIFLTCYSTVAAEAAYFNKPILLLDPEKKDLQCYTKNGLGMQVINAEDIIKAVNSIISEERWEIDHRDFVSKFSHKIDGKVYQRIIDFIKSTS